MQKVGVKLTNFRLRLVDNREKVSTEMGADKARLLNYKDGILDERNASTTVDCLIRTIGRSGSQGLRVLNATAKKKILTDGCQSGTEKNISGLKKEMERM